MPLEKPKESDWKRFRAIVPALRERYLAKKNQTIGELLGAPGRSETERFWDVHNLVQQEATTLRSCLDGHSRSSMTTYLLTMRGVGMLTDEDLAGFSPELQELLKSF